MSIVVVQTATPVNNNNSATTTCVVTFGSAITAGNCVFLCFYQQDTSLTITMSSGPVDTFTLVRGPDAYGFASNGSSCYIVKTAIGGNTTFTATFSSSDWNFGGGYEISGLNSNPLDQTNFTGSQIATDYNSGNITTTVANEILIGYGGDGEDSGNVMTAGASYSLIQASSTFNHFATEYRIVSSTGTYAATASNATPTIRLGGWTIVSLKGSSSTFRPDEDYYIPMTVI